ncbi:MAG: glycosyltransferase, partial [Bacteroidales bacterium]|nr:glycosyltransferase [Bacteroidales bacterium]
LVIVGSSKSDATLRKLVEDMGYHNYVDFQGWQNVELFPSYIQASKIGVCPIHKNIHHETTYANKIFQYISFGKPVIVSDCKAQAKVVEKYNCGLVFEDQNVEAFADKVLEMYQNKKGYDEFSYNGIKAVECELNWDVISSELRNLYKETWIG